MYIIINQTKNEELIINGNFPNLDEYYELGYNFYIISLYSMTIKIPISSNINDNYSQL